MRVRNSRGPLLALTGKNWFDYLSSIADACRVDEVNFWSPKAQRPMKQMQPGEPVSLRLKSPHHAIAGYGFSAHFSLLELDLARDTFGPKNGAPTRELLLQRLGALRHEARASRLFAELAHHAVAAPEGLAQQFELLDRDERQFAIARTHLPEGQGVFRTRLLDACSRRCATTGERTEPALDAAQL